MSNVPAFGGATSPDVLEYCTTREAAEWTPNIIYAVGNQDLLTFDVYFAVPKHFDRAVFRAAFAELTGAKVVDSGLPRYW